MKYIAVTVFVCIVGASLINTSEGRPEPGPGLGMGDSSRDNLEREMLRKMVQKRIRDATPQNPFGLQFGFPNFGFNLGIQHPSPGTPGQFNLGFGNPSGFQFGLGLGGPGGPTPGGPGPAPGGPAPSPNPFNLGFGSPGGFNFGLGIGRR